MGKAAAAGALVVPAIVTGRIGGSLGPDTVGRGESVRDGRRKEQA